MYINICKNVILRSEDIIGIFKLDGEKKNKNDAIIEKLEENKNIEDLSDGNRKSLIIYMKNGKEKGIYSNISSFSLGKKKEIN